MTVGIKLARNNRQIELDQLYNTYSRHHQASSDWAFQADVWKGSSEVLGVLGGALGGGIGIGAKVGVGAFDLIAKFASWETQNLSNAEAALAKVALLESFEKNRVALEILSPDETLEYYSDPNVLEDKSLTKILKLDPEAASVVNSVVLKDIKRITLSGFDVVRSEIEEEVEELSLQIDKRANFLYEKQREGFTETLKHLKSAGEQRKIILDSLQDLTELQDRTAQRLQAGQDNLIEIGGKILDASSSAARSGRLLVLRQFGTLPIDEQVAELNNPDSKWQVQLKESYGDKFDSYKDLVKSQQIRANVATIAGNVAKGIGAFSAIAKGLNWSIAEHPNFDQTVNVATSLATAVAGFAISGPMG